MNIFMEFITFLFAILAVKWHQTWQNGLLEEYYIWKCELAQMHIRIAFRGKMKIKNNITAHPITYRVLPVLSSSFCLCPSSVYKYVL